MTISAAGPWPHATLLPTGSVPAFGATAIDSKGSRSPFAVLRGA